MPYNELKLPRMPKLRKDKDPKRYYLIATTWKCVHHFTLLQLKNMSFFSNVPTII